MSSVEQIVNEFIVIDSNISAIQSCLQNAQSEISDTMNKAQNSFGDQPQGQTLVSTLSSTMKNVFYAESSMSATRQEISNCIQQLQK